MAGSGPLPSSRRGRRREDFRPLSDERACLRLVAQPRQTGGAALNTAKARRLCLAHCQCKGFDGTVPAVQTRRGGARRGMRWHRRDGPSRTGAALSTVFSTAAFAMEGDRARGKPARTVLGQPRPHRSAGKERTGQMTY